MSAAARGAAGYLALRRLGRRRQLPIRPQPDDVEAFVRTLVRKGVTEQRARELAAEQQRKTFNRARSGARR